MAGVRLPFAWLLAEAGWPRAVVVVVPMPLPERPIVSGLVVALAVRVGAQVRVPDAVTVRLPVRDPAAVGVNVTFTVQEEPAAILLPQLLVWLKSPEVPTEPTGAAAVPLLVTVTACGALDEPVATEPKPTAVGL